jgi:hypothetical protein
MLLEIKGYQIYEREAVLIRSATLVIIVSTLRPAIRILKATEEKCSIQLRITGSGTKIYQYQNITEPEHCTPQL